MSDLIPHGVCLASSPEIIGLIVFSNFSIALAYFAIPSFLAIGVSRFRTPVPVIKALFGVFIIGCGGTYVMDIVTMYLGGNWLLGTGCCLANYGGGKPDHISSLDRCPFTSE